MTGLDSFISTAASSVASIANEALLESRGQLLDNLAIVGQTLRARSNRSINRAAQIYAQNYVERYGFLRVLGKSEPIDLKSIYIPVYAWRESDIHHCESMENLEKIYRQCQVRRFQFIYSNKQQGIQAVNQSQYLMVLGEPGVGKSTFLRQIGLETLKGKKLGMMGKNSYIPVFIDLKQAVGKKNKLEHLITEEFRESRFPAPEKLTIRALTKGKLLLLLDGMNEVPESKVNEVTSQIQALVERYNKNRFIISCRTAAYRDNFTLFTNIALASWDDEQIEQFIENWFKVAVNPQNHLSLNCWNSLQDPENTEAKLLARNPLLLDFLCLIYERCQRFPKSRKLLYEQAWQILLASERTIDESISPDRTVKLLSEIAFTTFDADQLLFGERSLRTKAQKIMGGREKNTLSLPGNLILNQTGILPGILLNSQSKKISFYHPTLQEDLTAKYIKDRSKVDRLVADRLSDERWQPIFLLLAEKMADRADELLLRIATEAQKYINTPKLRALLNWAERVTANSQGTMKPAAKRAAALVISGGDFASLQDVESRDRYQGQNLTLSSDFDLMMSRDRLFASDLAYLLGLDLGFILARARILAANLTSTLGLARTPVFADELTRDLAGTALKVRSRFLDLDLNFALDAQRDIALDRTRDFALVCILAREYEKLKISPDATQLISELEALRDCVPGNNAPSQVHRAFRDHIRYTCFKALNLNPEMLNLSVTERENLGHYLYANCLMVQCYQVTGQSSAWEAIEAQILLVPD